MADEISVSGNKKIQTLQKEFTKKYPYIRICLSPLSEKKKKSQSPHSGNLKISEVRTKDNPGKVSLHGRTLVGTIEKNFDKLFGIYVQVCYTTSDGKRFYTGASHDKLSLTKLNKHGESEGWKKGVWG